MTEPRRIILKVLAFVAFIAAGAFILAVIGRAQAQEPRCRPASEVKQHFAEKYREKLVGRALSPQGPLAIFSSPEGKTFTIFVIVGNQACIVMVGRNLQIEEMLAGKRT